MGPKRVSMALLNWRGDWLIVRLPMFSRCRGKNPSSLHHISADKKRRQLRKPHGLFVLRAIRTDVVAHEEPLELITTSPPSPAAIRTYPPNIQPIE